MKIPLKLIVAGAVLTVIFFPTADLFASNDLSSLPECDAYGYSYGYSNYAYCNYGYAVTGSQYSYSYSK